MIASILHKYEQSSTARWTDAAIKDAINEGLDELSESTLFYERYVTIPLVADRIYYDLRGYLPESALAVVSIWDYARNDWLWPISEDQLGFKWEQSRGEPQFYFLRGLNWLGLWPIPSGSTTGYVRVYYAGLCPHYEMGQDVRSEIPEDLLHALEEYALYDLSAQDGETDKALQHWEEYTTIEADFRKLVEKRGVAARHGRIGGRR
jgi:hypothetical protein